MNGPFRLRHVTPQGRGVPLVLLPGLFAGRWLWEGVLAQCALRRRTAFVCDTSFLGMSGAPSATEELADLLFDDLAAAGIERAVIVGGSFGGLLALEFAGRRAASVEHLVLSGAPGFGNDFRAGPRSRGALTPVRALEVAARVLHDHTLLPARFIEDARREIVDPARFVRMLRLLRAAGRSDTAHLLRRVSSPTALIWGAHDTVTPLAPWTAVVDTSWSVRIIPRTGHAPMLEAPVPFSKALFAAIGAPRHRYAGASLRCAPYCFGSKYQAGSSAGNLTSRNV